eukprot:3392961-Heterocapsa_arctica.AAC.1
MLTHSEKCFAPCMAAMYPSGRHQDEGGCSADSAYEAERKILEIHKKSMFVSSFWTHVIIGS